MAAVSLEVTTDLPPSLNNAYPTGANGRRYLAPAGATFKESAGWAIVAAAKGWRPPAGARLGVRLRLYFPDRRRADIDNRVKLVVDALAAALGFDDCQVDHITVTREPPDRARPRCELELWEVDKETAGAP